MIFVNKLCGYGRNLAASLRDRAASFFFFLRCHRSSVRIFAILTGVALMASILSRFWPTAIRTSFDGMAAWIPNWISLIGNVAADIAEKHPGPTVTLVGLFVPFFIFLLARPDRRLQRRRIYMDLEFESARIFRTSVDHPEIVRYLEGISKEAESASELSEQVYWYVCQVLNTFELMISLYKEGMVQIDIFSTWVSWFHELGTARRFSEFWDERGLSFHYKVELQEIMDKAQELLRTRKATTSYDDEPGIFHRSVSVLFKDYRILQHFQESQRGKARRINRSAPAPVGSPLSPEITR